MTLQESCYRAVQELGGTASVHQVRMRLGVARRRVMHAMSQLVLKGFTVRLSPGLYRVAGNAVPVDGRGQSPSSQANIYKSPRHRKSSQPHPIPKLEIEKAWGWMAPFSIATKENED